MFRIALLSSLCSFALTLGCGGGGNDAEPYDTYQECFDDHTIEESLSIHDAIVVCCLDHPIAGVHPSCGDTSAACQTYLGTNLTTTATAAEVTMACDDYITEKGM